MAELKNEKVKATEIVAPVYDDVIGKITKVIDLGNDDRITFVLDCEFKTIDQKTGEEKLTNMIGINIFNIVNQIRDSIPQIKLADTLCMGKMINPQILALAMVDADVKIKRVFKKKGDKREFTKDVYSNDCVTSDFYDVKAHISAENMQYIMMLIATKVSVEPKNVIPNPFNM